MWFHQQECVKESIFKYILRSRNYCVMYNFVEASPYLHDCLGPATELVLLSLVVVLVADAAAGGVVVPDHRQHR